MFKLKMGVNLNSPGNERKSRSLNRHFTFDGWPDVVTALKDSRWKRKARQQYDARRHEVLVVRACYACTHLHSRVRETIV